MSFFSLPPDILILVIGHLSVADLLSLTTVCHCLHDLVHDFGGKNILHTLPRPSKSLAKSLSLWRPLVQVKYHTLSDKSWDKQRFVARPLSRPWKDKLQPLLAINESRLFVAAGHTLYSYVFTPSEHEGATPGISFEATYQLYSRNAPRNDITSIACAPDGGSDRTLFIGFELGELQRVRLPPCKPGQADLPIDDASIRSPLPLFDHSGELIEALSTWTRVHGRRSSPRRPSTPFAAFGTSSDTPLTIHAITRTSISTKPTVTLLSSKLEGESDSDSDLKRPTAVYGIATAPPASPWGASDQIIVSGWFDGLVRVHDMRASLRTHTHLCRSLRFGTCAPATRGWSVHAPGNDISPVYSIILESSRLFGATQSRPFVYDFGPAVSPETYPSLPISRGSDGLSYKKGRDHVGFYVTKYDHPAATVNVGDH
ncbi:hypothetical protein F5148DRAFT_1298353 [Russula earlei]|uniref:Uncharacterized protein n=1 Tax=Russula earlei TaxID=71964 RepID=A0ACC0UFU3_9AGAM|nr:hypothetical protein F5148DRAFT_1298353 [Russula earlei]